MPIMILEKLTRFVLFHLSIGKAVNTEIYFVCTEACAVLLG